MVRLDSPKSKLLTSRDFENHPIWTWDDENESYLPLSETDPDPAEYWGLLIKSYFITPDGRHFNGYLVGDYHFHAFGIFIEEKCILTNINMTADFIEKKKSNYTHYSNPFRLIYSTSNTDRKLFLKMAELFQVNSF